LLQLVGSGCFLGCSSLSTASFASNRRRTRIGSEAFTGCSSLTSVCIPASVVEIGEHCFGQIEPDGATWSRRPEDYPVLATVNFQPNSRLAQIASGLFLSAHSLPAITIPRLVESLGPHCFKGCFAIQPMEFELLVVLHLTIALRFPPALVRSMSVYWRRAASRHAGPFLSVAFEAGSRLDVIETGAFTGCRRLTALYIPASAREIAWDDADDLPYLVIRTSALGTNWFPPSSVCRQFRRSDADEPLTTFHFASVDPN
jgi:hypothetical protein